MADTPWTAEGLANWLEVRMRGDSAIPPTILEALLSYLRDPARAAAPEMAELLDELTAAYSCLQSDTFGKACDDPETVLGRAVALLTRIHGEDNA